MHACEPIPPHLQMSSEQTYKKKLSEGARFFPLIFFLHFDEPRLQANLLPLWSTLLGTDEAKSNGKDDLLEPIIHRCRFKFE